ncbi:histidine phosphatase family protein [Paenibacillus sp. Marseille-Q9583]
MNKSLSKLFTVMMAFFVLSSFSVGNVGANADNTAKKEDQDQGITFYLVRHGETIFNVQERMQGFSDSPLTEKGIEVAENLGRGLKNIPFVAAYSSTSERASDTADIVLESRNLKLIKDKRLREINFGDLEGAYQADVMKHTNVASFQKLDYTSVNGENMQGVFERAKASLDQMVEANKTKGGNVLVVSHGITILDLVMGLDPKAWDMSKGGLPNSSVTKIQWKDGKYTVQKVGDQSYAENGQNKLTFYFVRHGETLFNVQKRMQGFSDAPLTEEGIKVAEDLARGLHDIPFSAAYSSSSGRAEVTADTILEGRNMILKTDKRLREMNFGDLEGAYQADIMKHTNVASFQKLDYTSVNGENMAQVFARTKAAVDQIIADNQGSKKNIIVVSHGITILDLVMGLDPKAWDMSKGGLPNSSVTIVEWENGKFTVGKVGDTSYLEKGKALSH